MSDLIYGLHAVQAVLDDAPDSVAELWVQDAGAVPRLRQISDQAHKLGVPIRGASRHDLDRRVGAVNHQGVVARVHRAPLGGEGELEDFLTALDQVPFLLILDGVQDPHNLGACLRSAEAAGVQAVIMPRDRAVGLTPTVRKVASGAAERLPVFAVINLARVLRLLKDQRIWLVGAAGQAEVSLFDSDLSGPLALVMGGEGKGLRRLTREACDFLVQIPMAGGAESLNVSVATGVVLFEAVRQRRRTGG